MRIIISSHASRRLRGLRQAGLTMSDLLHVAASSYLERLQWLLAFAASEGKAVVDLISWSKILPKGG